LKFSHHTWGDDDMRILASALALSAGLGAGSASAATYYGDYFDFIDRFGTVEITTFNAPIAPPVSVASPNGVLSGGKWNDLINDDDGPTIWSFASAINGFGGFFDLFFPGGPGTGITVTLGLVGGGTEVLDDIPDTIAGTFWGFTSDTAFTSVSFSEGSGCCFETYTLDNLTIGAFPAPSPVPLPASFGLLAIAVGGIAAFGRKRRT
jgi:hypothetical protein